MTDMGLANQVQQVFKVNVENAPDQQRNTVSVNEERTEVLVSLVGRQGARGYGFISGHGQPTSSIGRVGDFYIDIDNSSFYGPKTASGWPAEPFYIPGLTSRYVHAQNAASSTWVINHSLGGYPSVTVVDSSSTTVIGEVSYVSTSQVQVTFTSPFSGYAYLT